MGKYTSAFTYLFKEKNWGWKLLIPVVGQLLVTLASAIISIPQSVNNTVTYKGTYAANFTGVFVVGTCILYAIIFIISIINMFYTYENAQSAIEKRDTKGIWQYKIDVLLKRIGKLYLVNLVYGIIPASAIICFVATVALLFVPASVRTYSGYYQSANTISNMPALLICMLCIVIPVILVLAFLWQYFITLPAQLRLFETNTFGEAFKFSRNFKIAKRNANEFLKLFLLNLLIVFVALIIFVPIMIVASLTLVIPVVGSILFALLIGLFGIVALYYQQFVMPYMTGILWREIKR